MLHLLQPVELILRPLSTTVRTRPEVALVLAGILALALGSVGRL